MMKEEEEEKAEEEDELVMKWLDPVRRPTG